jgi:cobalamin biosynthesis Mg chelatase CobN
LGISLLAVSIFAQEKRNEVAPATVITPSETQKPSNANGSSVNQSNNNQNTSNTENKNSNTVQTNSNTISAKEEETSVQSVKVSTSGLELSGFPTWINVLILIIAVIAFLVSFWYVPKAIENNSMAGIVIALLIVAIIFFFIGRIWDRWGATSEIRQKVEKAKEESRSEIPPSLPAAPTGLTVSPISSSQIILSWADKSNTEEGFKVERKLGSEGTYTLLATLGPNATTYADSGLAPETSTSYRIKSFNASGESVSNESNGATLMRTSRNENNWSNPGTWFWYVILPILFIVFFPLFLFGTMYGRYLMMRERRKEEEMRRMHH